MHSRAPRARRSFRLTAAVLTAAVLGALLLPLSPVAPAPAAEAVKASGGSGQYLESIEWFQWGAHDAPVGNGPVTNEVEIAGRTMQITCTISNLSGSISAYRPGAWRGDALDDMYNRGGTGGSNSLVVGLSGPNATTRTFDLACAATYAGADVPLAGLVFADAEQSGNAEHVGAKAPEGSTWRIIDRYRDPACTQTTYAHRPASDPNRLDLYGPPTASCASGPAAVAFVQGAQQLTAVTVAGGGKSAIALGVMLSLDTGDAPASYGEAGAILQAAAYEGGEVPTSSAWTTSARGVSVFDGFTLATPSTDLTTSVGTIGATIDGEGGYTASLGDADDLSGIDDEDAIFTFPSPETGEPVSDGVLRVKAAAGMPYSISVSCRGTGEIRGWIDWARDGAFGAEDASSQAACADGAATLAWSVPSTIVDSPEAAPSYLRLRLGAPGQALEPTGVSTVGETEDHRITVARQLGVIALDKGAALAAGASGAVGDTVEFSFVVRNDGELTLTDVGIDDPMLPGGVAFGAWPGTPGTLEPGQHVTATASHTLTQADLDAGGVVNEATAHGTPPGGVPAVQDTDDATVPLATTPLLTLVKDGALSGGGVRGDTIDYTFTITNDGSVTVRDVALVDDLQGLSAIVFGAWPGAEGELAPGDVVTARASYTVTQADADAGEVVNEARATGTTQASGDVSDTDAHTQPLEPAASIRIEKSHTDGTVAVGDTVEYGFLVTNDGDVTLHGVAVEDALPGLSAIAYGAWPAAAGTLAPGESVTATATVTVTQAHVDRGAIANTATVTGTPQRGDAVSDADTDTVAFTQRPAIALSKASTVEGARAGDTVAYDFVVENTGNVTLTGVAIADELDGLSAIAYGSWPGADGVLAPGERVTATASYELTQADVDRGSIANQATATGTAPAGGPVADDASVTDPLPAAPSMRLAKAADAEVAAVGATVEYRFELENTGNVTLTGASIDDPLPGLSALAYAWPGAAGTLAPGQVATATASYTITQADVDAGGVSNTATGRAVPPAGELEPPTADAFVPIAQHPAIALDKDAALATGAAGAAGDRITYSFVVRNTGDVTLTDVDLVDPKAGLSAIAFGEWPGAEGVLAPQQQVTATATYTLTQADVDAGFVENAATATGAPPTGDRVEGRDAERLETPGTLAVALDKSAVAERGAASVAGDTVAYELVIRNEGSRTLTAISLTDPLEGLSEPTIDWSTAAVEGRLAPGERVVATADYTLTQADVDAGLVENEASVAAEDLRGNPVNDVDDAVVALEGTALLTLDKSTTSEPTAVGDVLEYRFELANAGTVTLRDIRLVDELEGVTAPAIDWSSAAVEGELAPGESVVATASLSVTQAHLDAGTIVNAARATGTPDVGEPVEATDAVTVPLPQLPSIATSKAAALPAGSTGAVGEAVEYTIVVVNDGNVTLTDVRVTDPMFGADALRYDWSRATAEGRLAPGESVTATATRVLSQGDVDAGRVDNTATGSAASPAGPVLDADDATITIAQSPAMTLAKRATTDGSPAVGETVTFVFEAVNTGNVTLRAVAIEDPMPGLGDIAYDWSGAAVEGELAPGETLTATASVVIAQADLDRGSIANRATATGTPPHGDPVTPEASTTLELPQHPAIALAKTGAIAEGSEGIAGDTVEYAFDIVNVGDVTLTDVALDDPMPGLQGLALGPWPGEPGVLAPGQTVAGRASYVLTQADVDARTVENQATASATAPHGGRVTDTDDASVGTRSVGAIDLEKSATAQGEGVVGDTIEYRLAATNTGTVTLRGVTLEDRLEGLGELALAWPGEPGVLAPGETVTATATYALTQADVDRGAVENRAVASGDAPDGSRVEDADTAATPTRGVASLVLEKGGAVDTDEASRVGDIVTYRLVATNDGSLTLRGVAMRDELEGLSELTYAWPGEPGVLAPGESVTASATYVVTQADIDAGGVRNAATVAGESPTGGGTDAHAETTTPLVQRPELRFEKTAGAGGAVGDSIAYGFRLENAGNTTLTDVTVADAMPGLSPLTYAWPDAERPGVLLPGEVATATAAYALTQADVDAGAVRNTATASAMPPASGEPGAPVPARLTAAGEATTELQRSAGIALSKSGTVEEGATGAAGDVITYGFEVENTGTVTLTDVAIADAMPGLSAIAYAWPDAARPGVLLPGETATATASYALTADDLEHATIVNEATVTGVAPEGVEAPSDRAAVTVELPTPEQPGTGLPQTGSPAPLAPIVGGALLLLLGGVLLLRSRRARAGGVPA